MGRFLASRKISLDGGGALTSTCVGDLRQLLRVTLRSQGHCGFGRGLSLLNWVWCNRRGQSPPAQGETPALGGAALRYGVEPPTQPAASGSWSGVGRGPPLGRAPILLSGGGGRGGLAFHPPPPPPLSRAALLFGTHSAAAKGEPSQVIKSLVAQPCRSAAC